jgi:hypothetical protein
MTRQSEAKLLTAQQTPLDSVPFKQRLLVFFQRLHLDSFELNYGVKVNVRFLQKYVENRLHAQVCAALEMVTQCITS